MQAAGGAAGGAARPVPCVARGNGLPTPRPSSSRRRAPRSMDGATS